MTVNKPDKRKELINLNWAYVYSFKYKFRNMPYLVADKYGNFFILPHCPKKRTTEFKQLKTKGYVYYQGNKVRMSTLRKRAIESLSRIVIN